MMTPDKLIAEHFDWCKCDTNVGLQDCRFFDDGDHPDLYKHHWRCHDCGAVIQVG